MKSWKRPGIHVLLVAACLAADARAGLEFNGLVSYAGTTRVHFQDDEIGFNSGWIAVGEAAGGYAVVAYRAQEDILVLSKDGRELRLPLRVAVITPQVVTIAGFYHIAGSDDLGTIKGDLVFDQEREFPLPDGRVLSFTASRDGGRIKYHVKLKEEFPLSAEDVKSLGIPIPPEAAKDGVMHRRRQETWIPALEGRRIRFMIDDLTIDH